MELVLTPEEWDLLLDILEHNHQQILKEIWHTEHRDFKNELRKKERLLEAILGRLNSVPTQ